MTENDGELLNTFGTWIETLAGDAASMGKLLESEAGEGARTYVACGINYLFKSLDLIPDGIDDIGYLDDAFVLRVAAELATEDDLAGAGETADAITELAQQNETVKTFLDDNYPRLEKYVRDLKGGHARGRTVTDIIAKDETRTSLLADLHGFAQSYTAPSFSREEKNLIKLRAFFDAKLPR